MHFVIEAPIHKGYCCVIHDSEEYIINSLRVYDESKRQGVGTCLIKDAEKISKKLGAKEVVLFAYPNTWQHEWYKRMDYYDSQDETHGNFVKMKKKLK